MKSAPGSIDTSNLLAVCRVEARVDVVLLREMLGYFIDENARRMTTLRHATASGDRDVVRNTAHAVRGSAALLGAGRLHDLAWALEQDARHDDLALLSRAVENLFVEYQEVVASLRAAHPEAWTQD